MPWRKMTYLPKPSITRAGAFQFAYLSQVEILLKYSIAWEGAGSISSNVLISSNSNSNSVRCYMFQWSQMEAWWIGGVSFNTEGRHLWTSLNPRYIIKDDGNNMQHFGSMCAPPNSFNQILKGPSNQITLRNTTGSPLLPDYLINLLQIKYKLLKV